ncbi:hypothetical protein BLNAU_11344 [Blattamonas nauphoetae]|uniref:Uncharacterized protein n=1 Tax=Blattamonas nauphoetae TaxID=2049346 RepID=A0ABQ9XS97_9EUKA|nr:hypothetical protein BLNAU_11344 [Blattamonas nauphoetae]
MEDPELLLQELHKLETLQRKETTSFNLAQLKLEQLKSELQTLSTEADHLTKIFEENNTQIKTLSDNAKNEELHVSREELLEENLRSEIVHKKQSLEEEKQGKERELSALRNKFEDISNKCSSFCEFYSNQPSFKPIQALKDELKIVTLGPLFPF